MKKVNFPNSMLLKRRWLTVPLLLIALGGLYVVAQPIWFYHQRTVGARANSAYWQKQEKKPVVAKSMQLGIPRSLKFERLGINLNIVRGQYYSNTQSWQLDRANAFYVSPGTTPLQSDAVPLIYGHSIAGVFLNLEGIAPDELMTIINDKGQTLSFRYVNSYVVDPEQGYILNSITNNQNSINVLTCTGPWFSQRHIMQFEYVSSVPTVGRI